MSAGIPYQGYIFDLDGVLTRTEELHFAAWKALFDEFLRQRQGAEQPPFSRDDYHRHVNGKPRADGVRGFLAARGLTAQADAATVAALGRRKNELFQRQLAEHGVRTYEEAVQFLRAARAQGGRVAAVSSSRNAAAVLERAGLTELFDARVDGEQGEQLDLAGKPAPDYFLEAVRRLGLAPEQAVVFEDAASGVRAARAGGFGLVVGVAHTDGPEALTQAGADWVVEDVGELEPDALPRRQLPPAPEGAAQLAAALGGRRLGVFLDYDGTLTPIVSRPEDARLSPAMRQRLARLARQCPVAIVSGRDTADVQALVDLPELYYVGSHGFDIAGSAEDPLQYRPGEEFLPLLETAESELREGLNGIEGALLERKRYSIAIHYRNVAAEDLKRVEAAASAAARAQPRLKRGHGKKVIELRPRIDWHKGRAVHWLLERLGLAGDDALALYVGDDVTDEDVFRSLGDTALGIVVAPPGQASLAGYRLDDVEAVGRLLDGLSALLEQGGRQ